MGAGRSEGECWQWGVASLSYLGRFGDYAVRRDESLRMAMLREEAEAGEQEESNTAMQTDIRRCGRDGAAVGMISKRLTAELAWSRHEAGDDGAMATRLVVGRGLAADEVMWPCGSTEAAPTTEGDSAWAPVHPLWRILPGAGIARVGSKQSQVGIEVLEYRCIFTIGCGFLRASILQLDFLSSCRISRIGTLISQ